MVQSARYCLDRIELPSSEKFKLAFNFDILFKSLEIRHSVNMEDGNAILNIFTVYVHSKLIMTYCEEICLVS